MKPGMAVVISTYNNPEYLDLVLQGYEQQTDLDFCIYIADDGSSAATADLIQQFQAKGVLNIRHIWHEDCGFRKSRVHNLVFRMVTEDYVILTDGDCVPMPEMVATHRRFAQAGSFISGSRVLLSQSWTQTLLKKAHLPRIGKLSSLRLRLQKKINRVLPLWLPPHVSSGKQKLSGIHGCHLSLFMDDVRRINGFDESFEGWGREDSDLVARLFHSGVVRRNLRGTPVLHLWHRENARDRLENNDDILKQCLQEKRVRAVQGMDELEA